MKVVIVDDDTLVCQALKMILEADNDIEVAAVGNNADDAIKFFNEFNPDIMLMDIRMGEVTGIDAARKIVGINPDAKVLFLTTFADDEYIVNALKLGAKGYLLKQNFESIVPSLKAVYSGQNVFGEEIVAKSLVAGASQNDEKFFEEYDLTEREIDVIKLVADGLSNKEIAEMLFLSEGTVRNYLSTVLEKLELRDRTQLAIFYYKHK